MTPSFPNRIKGHTILSRRQWIWAALPFLLAATLMAPRLASAQFGMFDDATSIRVARQVVDGTWTPGFEAERGRFRPVYWLYHALIYSVFNANPTAFYASNTVLLFLTVGGVLLWVRRLNGSPAMAALAGCLFVLAGPVIEDFYTLSKGEPLQTLFALGALILLADVRTEGRSQHNVGKAIGAIVCLTLSDMAKETSVVVFPIAVMGWALTRVGRRQERGSVLVGPAGLLVAAGISTILYFVLQRAFSGRSLLGGGYSAGYFGQDVSLGYSALLWGRWLLRDFGVLIPLLGLALTSKAIFRGRAAQNFLLEPGVWAAGWVAVYLPWDFHVEYYLLPVVLAYCVSGAYLVVSLVPMMVSSRRRQRLLGLAAATLAMPLFLVTLFNNQSNARLQLVVDRVNDAMLASLRDLPPHASLLVNLPGQLEYLVDIRDHLDVLAGRPDIRVDRFRFQSAAPEGPQAVSYWVISPRLERSFPLSVRLGVYESGTQDWSAALRSFLGPASPPLWTVAESFWYLAVDPASSACLLVGLRGICPSGGEAVATGDLEYSWQAFHVESHVEDLDLPGVYSRDGKWNLSLADGSSRRISYGRAGDWPLAGDWDGDGFDGIGVYRPSDGTWNLDNDLDGRADMIFTLARMTPEDVPIVGDWNGDGRDTAGFYSPATGTWALWDDLSGGGPQYTAQGPAPQGAVWPVAGDWDGDGVSGIGLYWADRGELDLEDSVLHAPSGVDISVVQGNLPVAADWAGRGVDTLAFYHEGEWRRMFANCDCPPSNRPAVFEWGGDGDIPVAGRWILGNGR